MSGWEIFFLVIVAMTFLGFIAAVGGLQWRLAHDSSALASRTAERRLGKRETA